LLEIKKFRGLFKTLFTIFRKGHWLLKKYNKMPKKGHKVGFEFQQNRKLPTPI
jgi:hypothetical protein